MAQTVAAGAVFPRLQCSCRPLLQNGLRSREARLFCWFEPMDKAAVDYSLVITERTDLAADWPAASLVVLLSFTVHRTTTTPYAKSRITQMEPGKLENLEHCDAPPVGSFPTASTARASCRETHPMRYKA